MAEEKEALELRDEDEWLSDKLPAQASPLDNTSDPRCWYIGLERPPVHQKPAVDIIIFHTLRWAGCKTPIYLSSPQTVLRCPRLTPTRALRHRQLSPTLPPERPATEKEKRFQC